MNVELSGQAEGVDHRLTMPPWDHAFLSRTAFSSFVSLLLY